MIAENTPPPWDTGYWDAPDPLAPAHLDPFSMFLANEVSLQSMRDLGAPDHVVADQMRSLDRAYRQWRDLLMQRWNLLDPRQRACHAYLRQTLPQLMFWPAGSVLDAPR